MSDHLVKALGWSALLHLLFIALFWFTDQSVKVVLPPKAIAAYVYQPILPKPKPPAVVVPEPTPVSPPVVAAAIPEHSEPAPQITPQPEVVMAKPVNKQHTPAAAEKLASSPPSADSQTTTAIVTTATSSTNTSMSLAERSLAIATRRTTEVSSATLQASQLRPDLRDRPATTSKVQLKPEHAADNVLMVLKDGSFIEKIGDYCYHANQGANLRTDISSMKPVPCGKDKNAAMYERIMSKVGQDR